MTYIPSPEKLHALGFEHTPPSMMAELMDTWIRRLPGEPPQEINLFFDGSICLQHPPEIADEWGLDPRLSTLAIKCPSEAFFDQLLTAVGWAHE